MAQGAFKKNNSQANQFRRKKQSTKPQKAFTRRASKCEMWMQYKYSGWCVIIHVIVSYCYFRRSNTGQEDQI